MNTTVKEYNSKEHGNTGTQGHKNTRKCRRYFAWQLRDNIAKRLLIY